MSFAYGAYLLELWLCEIRFHLRIVFALSKCNLFNAIITLHHTVCVPVTYIVDKFFHEIVFVFINFVYKWALHSTQKLAHNISYCYDYYDINIL